jgi:hypothetical protein
MIIANVARNVLGKKYIAFYVHSIHTAVPIVPSCLLDM